MKIIKKFIIACCIILSLCKPSYAVTSGNCPTAFLGPLDIYSDDSCDCSISMLNRIIMFISTGVFSFAVSAAWDMRGGEKERADD